MTHILAASVASGSAGRGHTLFLALLPVVVLAVAFDIYCVVDVVRASSVRHLPKAAWVLIIVVISAPWGGLAYLFFGRDRSQRNIAPQ
jgi:hypothetical protein